LHEHAAQIGGKKSGGRYKRISVTGTVESNHRKVVVLLLVQVSIQKAIEVKVDPAIHCNGGFYSSGVKKISKICKNNASRLVRV
jgi:hypothetical protein